MLWMILQLSMWGCAFLCTVTNQVSGDDILDFCNGNKSMRNVSIRYKRESKTYDCRCNVVGHLSDREDDQTNYTIKSRNIKDPSHENGGYFKLSFTSGNHTRSVANESVVRGAQLFQASSDQETEIRLVIYPAKVPRRLRIDLKGGNWRLNVSCRSGLQESTTDYTSTATRKTTSTTSTATTTTTTTTTKVLSTPTPATATLTLSSLFPKNTTQAGLFAQGLPEQPFNILVAAEVIGAAVAGGTVVAVLTVVGIVAIVAICHLKRNKHTGKASAPKECHVNPMYGVPELDNIYSVADNRENNNVLSKDSVSKLTYFQLEPPNKDPGYINVAVSASKGYDHVTFQHARVGAPTQQFSDVYDHVTGKTDASDDCYNHAGVDVNQHKNVNIDYDTTASASKAVTEMENQDEYYSYDHLGKSTGTTVTDSDYDTTQPR